MNSKHKIKRGVWVSGDWSPTYYRELQQRQGIEFQSYAYSATGTLVHAGVTRHERMNQANANQIQRVWERWRAEYVARHPGNYPTALAPPVVRLAVFPVDQPKSLQWFYVARRDQEEALTNAA